MNNKERSQYVIFVFSLQTRQQNLENKVQELEERLKILDNLPSNQFIIDQAQQKNDDTTQDDPSKKNVLSGMWQLMKFDRRLQATEEAIDRVMTILNEFLGSDGKIISGVRSDVDDIASELKNLKESFLSQKTDDNTLAQNSLQGTTGDSGRSQQQQLNSLEKQLQERFVTKDELSVYVKWPALEEALNVKKTDLELRHSERYRGDNDVLLQKKSNDHVSSENKASDTESDGRPQTAPLPSTLQTPVPTPEIPKTAFASSTQVGSHLILFYIILSAQRHSLRCRFIVNTGKLKHE